MQNTIEYAQELCKRVSDDQRKLLHENDRLRFSIAVEHMLDDPLTSDEMKDDLIHVCKREGIKLEGIE